MAPAALDRPVDRLSRFFGLLLLGNLALLGLYEFVTFKYEVHSDSAVKVLLANEILETGELFPHEWVYANGDVYAFFCHMLALPLVPLFGPGRALDIKRLRNDFAAVAREKDVVLLPSAQNEAAADFISARLTR